MTTSTRRPWAAKLALALAVVGFCGIPDISDARRWRGGRYYYSSPYQYYGKPYYPRYRGYYPASRYYYSSPYSYHNYYSSPYYYPQSYGYPYYYW